MWNKLHTMAAGQFWKPALISTGVIALSLLSTLPAYGGHEIVASQEVISQPKPGRTFLPDDPVTENTIGGLFSDRASGLYLDLTTGLWTTQERDALLFLDSIYFWEDGGQFVSSTGLAFRKLLPGRQVILGANVYWDAISSERDHDYDQLGLGVEVLTRWVDFRFNYYLPEDSEFESGRGSRSASRALPRGGGIVTGHRGSDLYEAVMEGFNTELGFLIPGLDRYAEVRLFGGYYHYENPFGGDYSGFKARLEARLLPGVIADLEYWDDSALAGGHWVAGVRVSVPFSIFNLIKLRNPFEGAGRYFTPRPRELEERLGEIVIR